MSVHKGVEDQGTHYSWAAVVLVGFLAVGLFFTVYGYFFSHDVRSGHMSSKESLRVLAEISQKVIAETPLLGLQKRSIQEGFRSGRAIWTGHFRYDYLFFFANENIRGHIIFGSHHHFDPAPYWVKFTIFAEVMLVNFLLAEIANALSSHRYAFSIFIIYGYACLEVMIFEKVMETIALSEKLRARVRARGGRASAWGNGYGVGVAITVFLTICSSIALQWYAALVASRISTPPTLLSKLLSSIGLWATSQLIISAFLMVMFTYRFEVQLAEFKGDAPTHLYPYAGYPTVEFFKQQNPPACNHRGPPCCPPSGCRMRDADVHEAASEVGCWGPEHDASMYGATGDAASLNGSGGDAITAQPPWVGAEPAAASSEPV